MVDPTVLAASTGAIGLSPYGDEAEHTGPPQVVVFTPPYRRFFATDARSVLLTLFPQHYNLIPDPAFRGPNTGTAGWLQYGITPNPISFSWRVENTTADASLRAITADTANSGVDPNPSVAPPYVDGQIVKVVNTLVANVTVAWLKIDNSATLTVAQAAAVGITLGSPLPKYRVFNATIDAKDALDSWVGQSIICNGTGALRYSEGNYKYIYVGPMRETDPVMWDPRRGGPAYTFSVYAKGAGDVRLTMKAYLPTDRADLNSPAEYHGLTSVADPSTYAAGQSAVIETGTGRVWKAIDTSEGSTYNLLTANQASLETDLTGWGQTSGGTLSRTTSGATHGSNALLFTANTIGNIGAYTPTTVAQGTPISVTPGKTYTVTGYLTAGTGTTNVKVYASFRDAAGAWVGEMAGNTITAGSSGWSTATRAAPAGAVYLAVQLYGTTSASGQTITGDRFGAWEGPAGIWAMPGLPVVISPATAPFYEDIGRGPALATIQTEWTAIEDDDEWHRVVLRTRSRMEEGKDRVDFNGARWIDGYIEIRNANDLRISSAMLDPTEYPEAQYFDGGMTENLSLDDFLWENAAEASVSYYYFDRVLRAKWLYQQMGYAVPAGRPYQIFFGSYWRPYVGDTGDTVLLVPSAVGTLEVLSGMSLRSEEPQPPPPL